MRAFFETGAALSVPPGDSFRPASALAAVTGAGVELRPPSPESLRQWVLQLGLPIATANLFIREITREPNQSSSDNDDY